VAVQVTGVVDVVGHGLIGLPTDEKVDGFPTR